MQKGWCKLKKRLLAFIVSAVVLCTAFPAFADIISDETMGASCGKNLKWTYDTETETEYDVILNDNYVEKKYENSKSMLNIQLNLEATEKQNITY